MCCILHNLCITFGDSDDYIFELLQGGGVEMDMDSTPLDWYIRANNIDGVSLSVENITHGPARPSMHTPNIANNSSLDTRLASEGRLRRAAATTPYDY